MPTMLPTRRRLTSWRKLGFGMRGQLRRRSVSWLGIPSNCHSCGMLWVFLWVHSEEACDPEQTENLCFMILVEENNMLRVHFWPHSWIQTGEAGMFHFVGLKVDSTKHGLVNKLELLLDILNRCSIQLHINYTCEIGRKSEKKCQRHFQSHFHELLLNVALTSRHSKRSTVATTHRGRRWRTSRAGCGEEEGWSVQR